MIVISDFNERLHLLNSNVTLDKRNDKSKYYNLGLFKTII